MLQALIFDFEGTLADFQWRLDEAEAEAGKLLVHYGIIENTATRVHYAEGMNKALEHEERTGQPDCLRDLSALYDRFDADALTRWQIRPGVQAMLSLIRDKGLKAGLVSNVGRMSLGPALSRLGLSEFLEVVISRDEARWLKPHPRGITLAGERLGYGLDRVCFLGDSLDDIRAARNAGIPVVIIDGGQHSPETIREAGPDGIISDWRGLFPLLKQKGWFT